MPDDCYLFDIVVLPNEQDRDFFRELLAEFLEEPEEAELGLGQQAALLVLSRVEMLLVERPDASRQPDR
jgi:hypothetical protein